MMAKKVVTHAFFSMLCVVFRLLILPRYGTVALMIGSASVLSAYVAVLPEQFRSRSGSMMPVTCLVAVLWVAAAVVTAMTLMGAIRS